MQAKIDKSPERCIIKDFADEISKRKKPYKLDGKQKKESIKFRNEFENRESRSVWSVPLGLLRYRIENGRIRSDVLAYEKINKPLDPNLKESQDKIAEFLRNKDPEKTKILKNEINKNGQRHPAIITCDGFLINGNRRKVVLEELAKKDSTKFSDMMCVILPSEDDDGGSPTIAEIEMIENSYQLQSEGKSDYYGLDIALTYESKIQAGLLLEDLLKEDPKYGDADPKTIAKAVKDFTKNFLDPLTRAKRYLEHIGHPEEYDRVSKGINDPEGRWQAFIDFSTVYNKVKNDESRAKLKIEETQLGALEASAYEIIRLREVPCTKKKAHEIMRSLPDYLKNSAATEQILKIGDEVKTPASDHENYEKAWVELNKPMITKNLKNAKLLSDEQNNQQGLLETLASIVKKLESPELDLVPLEQHSTVRENLDKIIESIEDIRKGLYEISKKKKKSKKK